MKLEHVVVVIGFFFFFFPRSSLVTFQKCIKTKTERMEKDTVPDARLKVAA